MGLIKYEIRILNRTPGYVCFPHIPIKKELVLNFPAACAHIKDAC